MRVPTNKEFPLNIHSMPPNSLGWVIARLEWMRDNQPSTLLEMSQDGTLAGIVFEKVNQAIQVMGLMEEKGLKADQAKEVALDVIAPSDGDMWAKKPKISNKVFKQIVEAVINTAVEAETLTERSNNNEIPQYNGIFEPISQGQYREKTQEDRRMEQIASRFRDGLEAAKDKRATIEGDRSDGKISIIDQRDIESRIALDYAQENNLWFKDIDVLGFPFSCGDENTNYVNIDRWVLYKSNNLMHSQTITKQFERVGLHNKLFPDTKLELVGFMGFDHGKHRAPYVEPVFKQHIIGPTVPATSKEIEDYMQLLGFNKTGDARYTNGKYTVSDLYPRNVLKDGDGDIYVVDAEIIENYDEPTRDKVLSYTHQEDDIISLN